MGSAVLKLAKLLVGNRHRCVHCMHVFIYACSVRASAYVCMPTSRQHMYVTHTHIYAHAYAHTHVHACAHAHTHHTYILSLSNNVHMCLTGSSFGTRS